MTAVHPPVHQRQDLVVARVGLPHLVAGQAAVLVARHGHHALQVQFGHVAFLGVVAVEAVVEPRQHLLPLVLQTLVLAAQHPQRQHDEQHQDEAAGDGHGDHRRPEPHLLGRAQLLNPRHQVPVVAVRLVATVCAHKAGRSDMDAHI